MSGGKKPADETMKIPPGMTRKGSEPRPIDAPPTDSFVGGITPPIGNGPNRLPTAAVAPEVSQGKWRERVFTPRAVMSKAEVQSSMETALRVALADANHVRVAFEQLRQSWLPLLRQAMEQAGGDGLDAWLMSLFKPPGRQGMDPLLAQLVADVSRLRAAKDLALFEEEALKAVETVRRVMGFDRPRKLSFKVMEHELEGKLEVDELVSIAVSDDAELSRRVKEIGSTMELLRDQIKRRPGKQPDGLFSNFVRLKAELRVLDCELKRRGATPPK